MIIFLVFETLMLYRNVNMKQHTESIKKRLHFITVETVNKYIFTNNISSIKYHFMPAILSIPGLMNFQLFILI